MKMKRLDATHAFLEHTHVFLGAEHESLGRRVMSRSTAPASAISIGSRTSPSRSNDTQQ
jgi:hypothetical protein